MLDLSHNRLPPFKHGSCILSARPLYVVSTYQGQNSGNELSERYPDAQYEVNLTSKAFH